MYKNRSRGLKRSTSVSSPSASNLGNHESSTSEAVQELRESERASMSSTKAAKRSDHIDPPSKKAKPEEVREHTKEKSRPQQSQGSKKAKESKSSLLDSYVDIDINTMYMIFPSKFEELVTKSGVKLLEDEPFMLKKDQALFVRNLTILLSKKENDADQFIEGLEKFMESDENFRKMLLDTQTDPSYEDARSPVQDSLIRMFLCVDSIQSQVIALLLLKMATLIQRSPEEQRNDKTPWVELIVKRLCFLDQLIDGTALYNDIFRLLEIAPVPVQQELIYNLPYMIGDAYHEEVATRLMKLIETKEDLTPAVLEALGHLPLSADRRAIIRNKMMLSIKRVPVEFIPIIVKFVFTDEQSTHHDEVINNLRAGLPFTRAGDRFFLQASDPTRPSQSRSLRKVAPADLASSKAITFRNLRGSFLSIPSLAAAWLKNIKSITSTKEHRPIDVIMLLMMHSKASNRRKQVETVWRNRIKTGMFTDALLEETFEVLLEVLKRYRDDVLNVAAMLLRSSEPALCDYGSAMYRLAFEHFEWHMRRQVVSDLVMHISAGDTHSQSALSVLLQLSDTNLDKLAPLTTYLQNLLDDIDTLNLVGVRQMMDLLCRLAYAPDIQELEGSVGNLGDTISIIVYKQLGSFEPLVKRKGVVSAVMMLKHMACASGDSVNSSLENSSLDSLPPGRAKDASELFNVVMRSTRTVPEARGYCLDQLSFMIIRCGSLDGLFLTHLVDQMEEVFMASYLSEDDQTGNSSMSCSGLEMHLEPQFGLDKGNDDPIVLGIGALVLKEGRNSSRECGGCTITDNTYPLLVLSPLFRLFRVLKLRAGDESLEGIDALLGCAVSLPACEVYADFNSLALSQQGDVLDCFFYCINWFREVINAFSGSNNECYLKKVKIRLRNVVALQSTLARLLASTLHYTPPQCSFYGKPKHIQVKPPSDKPKKKGKKKGKKTGKKKVNDSQLINDSTLVGQATEDLDKEDEDDEDETEKDDSNGPVDLSLYRDFFRELDLDVFHVMKSELVITPPPEKGSDTTPDFSPAELRFLLEDYVAKLEHALPSGAANRFTIFKLGTNSDETGSFAMWDLIPAPEKAANAVSLLPILCEKLEQLGETCRNLLEANDGLVDGPGMFVGPTANVKICFGLVLRAMSATFAWNGFQSMCNADLLNKGLKVLATRLDQDTAERSWLSEMVKEAASYLKHFHESILHLDAGVYLVKLLQVLGGLWELDASRSAGRQNHVDPTKPVLKEVCHAFLSRSWSTVDGMPEKGIAYTAHVEVLVRVYFDSIENKLENLKELVPEICKQAKDLASKDSSLEMFPAVSKYNFYILYRVIYATLVKAAQMELANDDSSAHQIKVWSTVFKILESIVDITHQYTGRAYLAAILKQSRTLLKLFLDRGMPVLEWSLRSEPDEVTAILRSVQLTTRFVHKVCLSCKNNLDSALAMYTPSIRATMETLVYRVKGMLALNNIESVWNMGSLRNRDIHNVELCTQESNEDDESELPDAEEERDADVTMLESDSEEENTRNSRKSTKGKSKVKKRRQSNSGSEEEVESDVNAENDDEDSIGDTTSVSEAY